MLRSFVLTLVLVVPLSGHGQQPVDALTTCLADNTTGKDRKDLAKWIFLAMAAHPEMKQHVASAATAADDSARTVGALVERLLTTSCVNETKAVVQTGQVSQAFELAFGGLGKLAMQELMADKSVQDSMNAIGRHIDSKRIADVLGGK